MPVGDEVLVDASGALSETRAGGRRDEGGDMEPFESVVAGCDRAVAVRRPDPAGDRLQPDAVRVGARDSMAAPGARGLFGEFS